MSKDESTAKDNPSANEATSKQKKDASAKEKKAQILAAATRLLTQKGLQTFSFESVANEAGLSRQLVRYYYADLDELIVELCNFLGLRYQELLVAGIVKVGQVERLKFFLDFFFGVAEDHPMPDDLEAYDAFFAYSIGSEPLRDHLCRQYKTLGQVVNHELAIAHPELDAHSCEELSFLFVSMMHAHWSYIATLGYSSEHNKLTRRAFDRLIESYVREQPPVPSMKEPWACGS
ncbi:MAG: TetR/AcrR family transcriptional regulator [Pseudomonadota bacterium]